MKFKQKYEHPKTIDLSGYSNTIINMNNNNSILYDGQCYVEKKWNLRKNVK